MPIIIVLFFLFVILPAKVVYAETRLNSCLPYTRQHESSITTGRLIFKRSPTDTSSLFAEWKVNLEELSTIDKSILNKSIDFSDGCLIEQNDSYTQFDVYIQKPINISIRNSNIVFQNNLLTINQKTINFPIIHIKKNSDIIEEEPELLSLNLQDILPKKIAIQASNYNEVYVAQYPRGLIVFSKTPINQAPIQWTKNKIIKFIEDNNNSQNIDYDLLEKKLYCFIKKGRPCSFFDLWFNQ